MQITWPDNDGNTVSGELDRQLVWIAEAIGVDATASLVMSLGGTQVVLNDTYTGADSMLGNAIGAELAQKLSAAATALRIRIPLANRFMARHLRSKGFGIAAIARQLRMSDVSVRAHLLPDDSDTNSARRARFSKKKVMNG